MNNPMALLRMLRMTNNSKVRLLFDLNACIYKDLAVISDLHIGIEDDLGIKNSTANRIMLSNLELISEKARKLIILGDVKNSIRTIDHEVEPFLGKVSRMFDGITITKGNHDGDLQKITNKFNNIELAAAKGKTIDEGFFFHGHSIPDDWIGSKNVFIGHMHPAAKTNSGIEKCWYVIEDYEVALTKLILKTKAKKLPKITVLPAFNPLLIGSVDAMKNSRFFKNVFKYLCINVYTIGGLITQEKLQVYR